MGSGVVGCGGGRAERDDEEGAFKVGFTPGSGGGRPEVDVGVGCCGEDFMETGEVAGEDGIVEVCWCSVLGGHIGECLLCGTGRCGV